MCLKLLVFLFILSVEINAKDEKRNASVEVKVTNKMSQGDTPALLFADELKQIIERYMFGICPQPYKMMNKKNTTTIACDLDTDQQELAGRLATLALRAHTVSRTDCTRFGVALANTLGDLARTANNRLVSANAAAASEKKRKLSKSQKAKIAAKQRTALAVKKKAAAVAAANAAKMAAS